MRAAFGQSCALQDARQTSAGEDERSVSLALPLLFADEGKKESSGIWHGSTEMGAGAWICDLL